MRAAIILLLAAVAVGCDRREGGAGDQDKAPVTGRGTGQKGDPGGKGRVYERGGPPESSNPTSQQPGSGRVDEGGGKTSAGPIDNSVPDTNSPRSGPSGHK